MIPKPRMRLAWKITSSEKKTNGTLNENLHQKKEVMYLSDILILGYYGFKNSGDDTLLLSIIQQLKKHDETLKLCVLSQTPEETKAKYGVNAVKRNNPVALIKALLSCKMLLVGGGTLIQDGTSTKSLLYYLTNKL